MADVACSAHEALTMLQDRAYDLLFVEHDMPGLTGLDMLLRLRHFEDGMEPHNPQPFVLFLTPLLDRDELAFRTIETLPGTIRAKARELGAVVHPKTCPFSLLVDLAAQASIGREAWEEILDEEGAAYFNTESSEDDDETAGYSDDEQGASDDGSVLC